MTTGAAPHLSLSLSSCLVRLQSCRVSSCWVTSSAHRQFTSSLSCSGALKISNSTLTLHTPAEMTQIWPLIEFLINIKQPMRKSSRYWLASSYRQWGHWALCSVNQRCQRQRQTPFNIHNIKTIIALIFSRLRLTRMQLKQQSLEQWGQRRASLSFSMQMKQRNTSAMLCTDQKTDDLEDFPLFNTRTVFCWTPKTWTFSSCDDNLQSKKNKLKYKHTSYL